MAVTVGCAVAVGGTVAVTFGCGVDPGDTVAVTVGEGVPCGFVVGGATGRATATKELSSGTMIAFIVAGSALGNGLVAACRASVA